MRWRRKGRERTAEQGGEMEKGVRERESNTKTPYFHINLERGKSLRV